MKLHPLVALCALLLCLAAPVAGEGQAMKGVGGPVGPRPDPGPPVKITDVAINKEIKGPVVAGQTASFFLYVTNTGTTPLNAGSGIQVVDTLPNGFSGPMTGGGSGWSCNMLGTSLFCSWVGGSILPTQHFPPITVTAVAGSREAYENCARVRITRGRDERPANDVDCVSGRIDKPQGGGHDVWIRKQGPAVAGVGQTATFTLQVGNNGPAQIVSSLGLTVTDSLPEIFTNVQASGAGWQCTVAGGQPAQVTCTYIGAPVNAGLQLPPITITGVPEKTGPYLNCAAVEIRKARDGKHDDNRDCVEGRVGEGGKGVDVGIRKAFTPPSKAGDPAIFTLQPFNTGPSAVSAASGIQVTDTLPANFQPNITAVGTNWSCSVSGGGPWTVTCLYTGPAIGPNTLMPSIQISAAIRTPGKFTNCADISIERDRDRNPRDNRGCVTGEVVTPSGKKPDIEINKTALDQPWTWPSGTGVYRFRISNVGDTAVPAGQTVTLTESLPAGMALVSTPNAWSCSPGVGTTGPATVICTYVLPASLNPGAFIQLDMTVGFNGKLEPRYQNCASVAVSGRTGPWREVDTANNTDCVPVEIVGGGAYDVAVEKAGPDKVAAGQDATFTLSPYNVGPSPVSGASGVIVTDTLPDNFVQPITVNGGPNWTCQVLGSGPYTVRCVYTGPSVGVGQTLPQITITARAKGDGEYQNCAEIDLKAGHDVNPANNRSCIPGAVTEGGGRYNVSVTKEGPASVNVGQNATFVLHPWNVGPSPVSGSSGVFVDDALPANFGQAITIAAGPFWTCQVTGSGPYAVHCEYTGPAVGQGQPLPQISISTQALKAGDYLNCADINLRAGRDANPRDNRGCASGKVISAPPRFDLSLSKKASAGDWTAGGSGGQFDLVATNNGPGPVPAGYIIRFTDHLPAGMQLTSVPSGWSCTPPPVVSGAVTIVCQQALTTALGPNQSITLPMQVSMIPPFTTSYQNCATVSAVVPGTGQTATETIGDNNADCVRVTPPARKPDLSIVKSVIDDCFQSHNGNDSQCTFGFTVTNNGSASWTGVVQVSDTVTPQNASFVYLVGGQPAGWTCLGAQPMVCSTNGPITLPAGGSVTFQVTMQIDSPVIPAQNCASLPQSLNTTTSCVPLGATATIDLSASKTLESVGATGDMNFVLVATNHGSGPQSGPIVFTDTLPPGLTPTNGYGVNWTNCVVAGQTISCTYNGPPVGVGLSYPPLNIHAASSGPGPFHNCATVSIPGAVDAKPGDNTACADASVQQASLSVTKSQTATCMTQSAMSNALFCTFQISITNAGPGAYNGPVTITDTLSTTTPGTTVINVSNGVTCTGAAPAVCQGSVGLNPGDTASFSMTFRVPGPANLTQNCATLGQQIGAGPFTSCIPVSVDLQQPSLQIEKVVEQDCYGSPPSTECRFSIRVFNQGNGSYTGNLTVNDTVMAGGNPAGGVSLASPLPPGWTCTGFQPLSCSSNGPVTIPQGGYVLIPITMTINGAIPPTQNCAMIMSPLTVGPSCVPIGHTHYDLLLDSNFLPDPNVAGMKELSYYVSSTPQMLVGTPIIVSGSLTAPGVTFSPWLVTSSGWSCSGTWAGFLCTTTYTGGAPVLRMRTSYGSSAVGLPFTYVGTVSVNGNVDPYPANNTRTVSSTLP